MPRYTYKIDESDKERIKVTLYEGAIQAAVAKIMHPGNPDLESYGVTEHFKGKGLAYALTHLMLLYCKDKNTPAPTVSNAHGILIKTLTGVGFRITNTWRDPKASKDSRNAASLQCVNIAASLTLCKAKMLQKGLIQDGLRNDGPYQWKS